MTVSALTPTQLPAKNQVPRGALIGAAALVVFTLAAAFAGRMTGFGTVTKLMEVVVVSRDLRFEDGPDGQVFIRRAEDGRIVDVLAARTNSFVRSTMRGLARARKQEGIGSGPPFRLSRLKDGRLTLEDSTTQRRVDLDAFGSANVGAFAAILNSAVETQ